MRKMTRKLELSEFFCSAVKQEKRVVRSRDHCFSPCNGKHILSHFPYLGEGLSIGIERVWYFDGPDPWSRLAVFNYNIMQYNICIHVKIVNEGMWISCAFVKNVALILLHWLQVIPVVVFQVHLKNIAGMKVC